VKKAGTRSVKEVVSSNATATVWVVGKERPALASEAVRGHRPAPLADPPRRVQWCHYTTERVDGNKSHLKPSRTGTLLPLPTQILIKKLDIFVTDFVTEKPSQYLLSERGTSDRGGQAANMPARGDRASCRNEGNP
jgi:hypothetical protein